VHVDNRSGPERKRKLLDIRLSTLPRKLQSDGVAKRSGLAEPFCFFDLQRELAAFFAE
jgi:hypothetical protein